MNNEQPSLFDITPTVKQRNDRASGPERTTRPTVRAGLNERPSWSAYAGKHTLCTEGVRLTYEAERDADLVGYAHRAPALYRRKHGGTESLLCTPCARHWREADGMGALPGRNKK